MKVIQKTIRKQRNSDLYRANLKYENGGKIRVISFLEAGKGKAKNVLNFRLGALTQKATSVDISEMIENRRKVSIS